MTIKSHISNASFILDELTKGKRLKQEDYLEISWRLAATIYYIEKKWGVKINRAPLPNGAVEYYLTQSEIIRLNKMRTK